MKAGRQKESSKSSKGEGPVAERRPECSVHLNNELLLAITPWMGNLLVPLPSTQRCEADVVRETTLRLGLTSTPVFSLFLKILSIDAKGCKKVIEGRKRVQSCIPQKQAVRPPPKISRQSHEPTVAQLLYEKRLQEYRKKKESRKTKGQQSQLLLPCLMIPQATVLAQSALQVNPPLAPPSTSAADKSTDAKGQKEDTSPPQKRPRTSAKKVQAPSANSQVTASDETPKRTHLQNIRPKNGPNANFSQVTLTSPLIRFILTPDGLLAVNGPGIPVATHSPPVGGKEGLSNMFCFPSPNPTINSQRGSLTSSVKAESGAQPPSKGLKISHNASVSAAPPVSSAVSLIEEGAPLKAAPSSATSTDVPAGQAILVPSPTGLTHSTTPSALVSLSQCNTVSSQIALSTLTPAPASESTFPSNSVPPKTDTQFSPVLSYSQGLTTLQVCQPHTRALFGSRPISTVTPPAPPASQETVVHIVQPPSTLPPSKPALAINLKPEPVGFDPNLMFLEDTYQLKEWLKGAIVLSQLDITLPYLPPFVSSMTTLTSLLKCKADLEKWALPLVSSNRERHRDEPPEKAIRQVVAERLGSNPAYLLLKARFLACFTFPAFLATIPPYRNTKSPVSISPEKSEGEEGIPPGEPGGLLRAAGEGAVAAEFSGISTRSRNIKSLYKRNSVL